MAKSKQADRDPNIELAITVVAVLIIYFAAIVIPVGDKKDVYIDFKVQKELTGKPKLIEVNARVQPSTALESPPFMGAIWGVQASDVSVIGKTDTVNTKISIGDVTTGIDISKRLVLKNVPQKETILELQLYEGQTVIETKVIEI